MTANLSPVTEPETATPTPAAPASESQKLVLFLLTAMKPLKDAEIIDRIATATTAGWRAVYRWKAGAEALPPYRKALRAMAATHGYQDAT